MSKPLLIVKRECPFCFKFLLWLNEVGKIDAFEINAYSESDSGLQAWRDKMEASGVTPGFPAVQTAPGEFLTDSDALIDHYAQKFDLPSEPDWIMNYYLGGLLPAYVHMFKKLKDMDMDPHS